MSDIDLTDLLERITGCINNAEYDDEQETLTDAFAVIEAQAAEIEKLRVECEFIASVTASPLINPLEFGFRHSPLTQRERETRYMEACALAYQSARAALGETK